MTKLIPEIIEFSDGTKGYFYSYHFIRELALQKEINGRNRERHTHTDRVHTYHKPTRTGITGD